MVERIVDEAIEKNMRESYVDYAMSVIVGRAIPDVRDGLKPVHRRILYTMYDLSNTHDKPYKKSARIVGDCFIKDTAVLTTSGLKPIQEIKRGETVFTQSGFGEVTELYEMPERELLKITLKNGISNVVTPSQKFKVLNKNLEVEWKEAKDLTEEDYLVARAEYPKIKENVFIGELDGKRYYLNENIGYLLGQLLSDDWVEKGYNRGKGFRCGFCSSSTSVIKKLISILKEEFNYEATIEEKDNEVATNSGQVLIHKFYSVRINKTSINEFLVYAFALQNAFANTKIIPNQIFISPKNVIFSFISGLIDGDGSVHRSRNVIHYGSVSEKLIDQLQILLQHFGIFSKKYTDANTENLGNVNSQEVKGNNPIHSLEISSRFVLLLSDLLTLAEEKKADRSTFSENTVKVSGFDEIPYAGELIFDELSRNHIGSGWYVDENREKFRMGIKYPGGCKIRHSKDLKEKSLGRTQILDWNIKEKLNKINSPLAKFINHILENNIYFLKVERIEQVQPEKTYDLQVEGEHEFIANGFLSHNCMGKYHPHGDAPVYESLVRMAQTFSMRYTLVDGQGNFGSIDDDPPAAQRYTEVRMAKLADEMLRDLEKETVEFVQNFDGTLKEPTVLPSVVPTLLINGSAGIAVGMATNIPPHNLNEIIDACISLIDGASEDDLIKIVKGPDFPTRGIIVGRRGIYEAYKTGRGIIRLRGRANIKAGEMKGKEGKAYISIKEIPYQVPKTAIIEAIAEAVKNKKIEGISGVHDRSDREGIEVLVELKRDANAEVVLNQLYAHTPLEVTFGIINLVLVGKEPKVLPIFQFINQFIEFRKEIVTKRCVFDLRIAMERAHILEGLRRALENIDAIVTFLKASKDVENARNGLMKQYTLSEKQANAILDMKLQKLISLEHMKIDDEYFEIEKTINELKDVLSNESKILQIIKDELAEIKNKYGDERRTEILDVEGEITDEQLIPNDEVIVTITHRGYIKRVGLNEYRSQRRGGRGVVGGETKEEDIVQDVIVTRNRNNLLFFTNQGRVYWLKTYEIPETGRYASGKPIVNLLQMQEQNERVSSWISVGQFNENEYLSMITKNGIIKRISLDNFSRPRKTGIIAITLKENDALVEVVKTDGKQDLLIATRKGQAIRFEEEEAREIGRTGQGVIGIRFKEGEDEVVGIAVCNKPTVVTVTENGFGKRTLVDEYRLQGRGGSGVINIKTEGRNGNVVGVKTVTDEDEIIVVSSKGQTIRMPSNGISVIGRNTQGVTIIKMGENEKVSSFAITHKEETVNNVEPIQSKETNGGSNNDI